jgi:hypothetical protein
MSAFEPIEAVARVMAGFPRPWFVSGGWAIDLFVGRVTREHEDLEVGLGFRFGHSMTLHSLRRAEGTGEGVEKGRV